MHIIIETITPRIAEAWLNANKSNRKMRDGVAEKYADDMKFGRWTSCPEPISFYLDGDLADGQHRLWAIVDSGTTQTFPVARGLTREDGLNLNTGLKRDVVDNARISGTDTTLSRSLIAAAKAIELGTLNGDKAAISNAALLAIVERNREAATFAAAIVRRRQLLCSAAVMGAVGRAYLHEPDRDRLKRFCDVLGTGFYEGPGETAAVTLRNYLLAKGSVASSSALWRDTFLKSQNAIFYFMRDRKLTAIKSVAEDQYPLAKSKMAIATRKGKADSRQRQAAAA
jgi:hypothetical protein